MQHTTHNSQPKTRFSIQRPAFSISAAWLLFAVLMLGLGLRLLAWRWHEQVPLGGDEQEYFNQALILLRDHQYVELKLMRPPGYTAFLSASMYLFDSLVQRLRLIQAIISTATILPIYAFSRALFGSQRIALFSALLMALSYTLASTATELLTETLFVCGLSVLLWLLAASGSRTGLLFPILAGLTLGVLVLTRSVALPLLGVGVLWLLQGPGVRDQGSGIRDQEAGRLEQTPDPRPPTPDRRGQGSGIRGREGGRLEEIADSRPQIPDRRGQGSGIRGREGGRLEEIADRRQQTPDRNVSAQRSRLSAALAFLVAALLVILPWTARNYLVYGSLILVDTTGAENLWLDNDPAGREAVKAQLYALGEDRALRQSLSSQRGVAAILSDPARFVDKAWNEAQRFMALEHTDDMLARPGIWLPPAEIWLRLILGDGLWLLILVAGVIGLWTYRVPALHNRYAAPLLALWCLYIMGTSMLFHVELRYRLPVYPALIPFAAALWSGVRGQGSGVRREGDPRLQTPDPRPETRRPEIRDQGTADSRPETADPRQQTRDTRPETRTRELGSWRAGGLEGWGAEIQGSKLKAQSFFAVLSCIILLGLMLLQRNYPAEALRLASKHMALAQANRALDAADMQTAREAARRALSFDERSALARVALARAALLAGDTEQAQVALDAAIKALPAHPYAHLLRGAMLRASGQSQAARDELVYESVSREDLQAWTWDKLTPIDLPVAQLEIGDGLDLGYIRGFYLSEDGYRWTKDKAYVQLYSAEPVQGLMLELGSGRPASVTEPQLEVFVNNVSLMTLAITPEWNQYEVRLPSAMQGSVLIELRSSTFRPRSYEPASGDARELGVKIKGVKLDIER